MKITKTCVYTNRKNTMEINITEEQYQQFKAGTDIDECMPTITYEEREFLLTGALPEEIDDMYEESEKHSDPYNGPQGWDWD